MKNIRIIFVLLWGLLTPSIVRSGELLTDVAGAAESGFKEVLDRISESVGAAGRKALSAVADRGEDAIKAVQDMIATQKKQLAKLGDSLGTVDANVAKSILESFEKKVEEGTNAIVMMGKDINASKASELAARIGKTAGDITRNFKNSLSDLDLSDEVKQAITGSMDAAAKDSTSLIAGAVHTTQPSGTPQPEVSQAAEAIDTFRAQAERLTTQHGDLDSGATRSADQIGNGSITGADDISLLDDTDEAVYGATTSEEKELGYWARRKGRLADIQRLSDGIDSKSKDLLDLEEQAARERVVVTLPHDGGSGSVEIPPTGFRIGSKSEEQVGALETFLGGAEKKDIDSDNFQITSSTEDNILFENKEVLTVKVTIKGGDVDQVLEFTLRDPSDVEKLLLKEGKGKADGTFSLGKDGRLSFRSENESVVKECSEGIANRTEKTETLKEEITQLKVRRSERENGVNAAGRTLRDSGKSIKAAFKDKAAIKATAVSAGRGIVKLGKWSGSKLYTGVTKIGHGTIEVLKMMMTGVFFGVPSMIYQTLMQQAAAKALYEQITAVYHITPDFAVQIPASLISPSNAAAAGTYLYVAVDPSTTGYGNNMSPTFLENASYYVVYQTGAQWGSTYATSQNAFGAWVSLNTGLVFMDGGVPYSEQTPYSYLMEPSNDSSVQAAKGAQTTLSVQQYTQEAFGAVGNRANYNYSEGFLDSVAPWHIATESYDHAVTPSSMLQTMFAPVEGSGRYAPKLLVRTLNFFRNGIQNVPGFLPGEQASTTKKGAQAQSATLPKISIKQFQGTGILNRLLGSQSSSDNIMQSIQLIATLSAVQSSKTSSSTLFSTGTKNVIQTVVDAQVALRQALSSATGAQYGTQVVAASAALKDAQAQLQTAIGTNGAGTNLGLDPSIDANAYSIYLYETEDTPIVQCMKKNRFSDLIPVKDYTVFLDANLNIVPLFSTAVITRPDGVTVLDFNTSQINQNIQYMVSLVTGLIYQYSSSGPGTIMPTLNNMPAAQYVASTVMPALFQQIALALASADATDTVNQIVTMANYATNLSYQGPVSKNGCLFEKVPLEISSQNVVENTLDTRISALNVIPIPAQNPGTKQPSFGPLVALSQSQLDSLCVYKVSKIVQGSQEREGVFGSNATGQPVYDYVVPFTPVSLADSTSATGVSTYYQIMPLGLTEAMGKATTTTGELLISLVTGQVYDSDYRLLTNPPYHATVIKRADDFTPILAQPGEYSVPYTPAGQTRSILVAAVRNLPLGTAFMPTFCNPYNIVYGSLQNNPLYVADFAALTAAQAQVNNALTTIDSDLSNAAYPQDARGAWKLLQQAYAKGGQDSAQSFYDSAAKAYAPWLILSGEAPVKPIAPGKPAAVRGKLLTDMQSWITASAALIPAEQKLQQKVQALQSMLQPPYMPVKKATDQMVIMCPMYWMNFSKLAWAPQSAAAQAISYTNASQQPLNTSINWINTTASSSATPLGCSLGQSLPVANTLDIINAYDGWQEIMNSTNGVAKVMQSGPFQFSENEQSNVYLTLPPSNGPLNLVTGNFFYNMVPVASPTSLFVMGNLDAGIAGSINNSLNKNATMGLTAPLTIDQCNTNNLLGHSYLELIDENPVAIDISSGDVWLPTPLGYSATCYKTNNGNIANASCNVLKIGTIDAQAVLNLALQNQGTTKEQIQNENPGLYSMLMNAQALAIQKAQLALTTYFAGNLLSLCQEEITNGTYIYAVNVTPANYYTATDYWVVTDVNGTPKGVLTPQSQYMMSLVTGNVYQMNVSGSQQTSQSTTQTFNVGTGIATIETPLTAFQQIFGTGPYSSLSTTLTPVATNNPKLFNIIEALNNLQQQAFLQSQLAPSANTEIEAGQIPLAALQTATPVSALYNTLYLVNGKYYLAMPGTNSAPTYYYDFNAELQDVNNSSGTAVYTPIAADAQRGMYYVVEGTGSTAVATPVSALTGYGCQAMRMRFGIKVAADGTETMGLPVYNPPLPMTANDAQLAPGASGDNMKCLTSAANIARNTAITDTYTYYQYKNIASESYLTRCYLKTQLPVYNQVTQSVTTVPELQDYYVDLVTGECYSPDGTPKLSNSTVAYNFTGDSTTGIVANSALDFSNPLFVWGELDLLGESLQANMMYQDTNSFDPSNGYNQYQVQPFSTSFTLYNGSKPTVYAYAVDGTTGAVQITQDGNPINPVKTSMSATLVAALNSGATLATKSYIMNINGVIPSGTPAAGATVTVTETFVAPKQYMISYTNAAGTVVNDMFQAPVISGTGTAPGVSSKAYNNPPLDAPFQAQLLQGKPFCARVFASCPYGKETVQNINTTIATTDSTQQKELALGTTGITCGLLQQPATASSFTLSSAGLLSAIFTGANPNGSTGAMNGQYFAFYDCYNNGTGTSSNVVPNKGQYGTYTSVVSSMLTAATTLPNPTPFPGLYGGNFNVEFASSAGSTATTYGAPYLRIMPLGGAFSAGTTNYALPTSGTEYLYKYLYDIVPNAMLSQLKSTLNISGNVAGFMQLVSAIDTGSLAGVSATNASMNEAAAVAISNQVFYGKPLNTLAQEPKGRYIYKLACSSGGADAVSSAPTNPLCQMFFTAGASNPDTYIDMYNGIVFQSKTVNQQQLLYPIGFSVSHDYCNGISQMVGGAMPAQDSTALVINTPVTSTAVTKTNPKGLPVGQGAALPGHIVKGAVVAAPAVVPAV